MKSYQRTAALSATYKAVNIDSNDARIHDAVEAYKAAWGLPAAAQPVAETWFGIFEGENLLVVAGEKRQGTHLEVTDLYIHPATPRRKAVAAIYALLNVYATALRRGLYTSMVATVLYRNTTFQKAVQRVFNVQPTALVYMAESA